MYSLIFRGRRSTKLQKWRYLSSSVNHYVSAFSNSLSSASGVDANPKDVQKGKKFTGSYLVNSLGLAKKLAESISRKVSFEDKSNPDSVLNLFRNYGFTDTHISSIISDYPMLLIADAEKSIAPKLQILQSRGTSTSELTDVVSKVPNILGKKGLAMRRYFDFIRDYRADKSSKFQELCHSIPQGMQDNKLRNLSVLRELGVPQRLLFPLLISSNGGRPICGKGKFDASLKKILEMGFDPTTSNFCLVLRTIQGANDKTIEEKMDVYKMLGFTADDIWENFKRFPMLLGLLKKKILTNFETLLGLGFSRDECVMIVKRFPMCIGLSEETLKTKTEFLVKEMNWPGKVFGFILFGIWIQPGEEDCSKV